MASMEDFATVIAGDVDGIESRVATAETTVSRIKGTNVTYGQGAPPAGSAEGYPVGWWYRDMSTGNIYRVAESPKAWSLWEPRSTGWRDITGLIQVAPQSGRLLVCRDGGSVYVQAETLVFAAAASYIEVAALPVGWRPSFDVDLPAARRGSGDSDGALRVTPAGSAYMYRIESGSRLRTTGLYLTPDPMPRPADYPGVAA